MIADFLLVAGGLLALAGVSFWVGRAFGIEDGRDAQWVEDSCALERTLAERRDRTGRFARAHGPLVLPPRTFGNVPRQ